MLYNHHLMVDLVLARCKELGIKTLGEVLQSPREGELFCSTEELEGTEDVYTEERVRNHVLLPYESDTQIFLEFGVGHFVADTGRTEQSDRNKVSLVGQIRNIDDREIVVHPIIMGAPWLDHPFNKDVKVGVDLAWYGFEWYEIFPEDIDEFSRCENVTISSPDEWMDYMRNAPENEIKAKFCEILGDIPGNDWGGEQDDHFST
jgi:hypothetical protein